jgi:hypothetical protein
MRGRRILFEDTAFLPGVPPPLIRGAGAKAGGTKKTAALTLNMGGAAVCGAQRVDASRALSVQRPWAWIKSISISIARLEAGVLG